MKYKVPFTEENACDDATYATGCTPQVWQKGPNIFLNYYELEFFRIVHVGEVTGTGEMSSNSDRAINKEYIIYETNRRETKNTISVEFIFGWQHC